MHQNIFIIGATGQVGRTLIKQVVKNDSAENHVNPTRIIGLASRDKVILNTGGMNAAQLLEMSATREGVLRALSSGKDIKSMIDISNMANDRGLNGEVVFVDVTADTERALEFHQHVITQTDNKIVTANKNPVAKSTFRQFQDLTAYHGRYSFNTTVMGGAGAVNWLQTRAELGEKFVQIKGCFSGTLGYICSRLGESYNNREGKMFSEIVKEAKDNGYTEPNPWDDLNGLDVARKLTILARCVGQSSMLDSVLVEPFIDEKYSQFSGDEFFQQIKNLDSDISNTIKWHSFKGQVLRYVATANFSHERGNHPTVTLTVGPEFVEKSSILGQLNGTSNIMQVTTETHPEKNPHIIISPGAGLQVTANSIREDLVRLLPHHLKRRK